MKKGKYILYIGILILLFILIGCYYQSVTISKAYMSTHVDIRTKNEEEINEFINTIVSSDIVKEVNELSMHDEYIKVNSNKNEYILFEYYKVLDGNMLKFEYAFFCISTVFLLVLFYILIRNNKKGIVNGITIFLFCFVLILGTFGYETIFTFYDMSSFVIPELLLLYAYCESYIFDFNKKTKKVKK